MPTPPKPKPDLVEVQSQNVADLSERLGLLHEVVAKRQEEADALKHDLMQTQAQITSAKRQWEQTQRQEQEALAAWTHTQQEALALQQTNLSKAYRDAQASLQRTQAFEEDVRLRLVELNAKGEEFRALAQDRIDSGRLRQQAEAKLQEAQTLWGQAMEQKNQGSALRVEAQAIQAECETRNLQMQASWNKCRAWEEELRLKARDVEIREQALQDRGAADPALPVEPRERVHA